MPNGGAPSAGELAHSKTVGLEREVGRIKRAFYYVLTSTYKGPGGGPIVAHITKEQEAALDAFMRSMEESGDV
jgi:hypothetical protein